MMNNFRHQILLSITFTFFIIWVFSIVILNNYISKTKHEEIKRINNSNSLTINRYIEERKKQLKEILIKISYEVFNEEKNIIDIKKIPSVYNKIGSIDKDIKLAYYDKEKKFHDTEGDKNNIFTKTNHELKTNDLDYHSNIFKGDFIIRCYSTCRFYYIKTASNYRFHSIILQNSISFNTIMDDLIEKMKDTHLFILKKTNNSEIKIEGNHYELENTSSIIAFNKFKQYLSDKNNNNTKSINPIFDYFKYRKNNNVIFVTFSEKNPKEEILNELFNKYIISSLSILLSILVILSIVIKKLLSRIVKLKEILETIGYGDFKNAQKSLKENKRNKNYDELDDIYTTTKILAEELETTHINLNNSNQLLTKKISEISYLADNDTLTGLYNRRFFNMALQRTIEENQRFFLVSLDMNHFKIVNDTMGHAFGDSLLKEFSNVIRKSIDSNDIASRTGGDEFAIIIKGKKSTLIKKINAIHLKTKAINIKNKIDYEISCSIGIAIHPDDATSAENLSTYSDMAMYENKRYKASYYNFYTGYETLIEEEKNAQLWNKIIEESLNSKNLVPLFQPIVESGSYAIYAYEVLARVYYKSKMNVPSLYIEYIEKSRKIISFDRMIFHLALKSASQFDKNIKLMINISYYTLATHSSADYFIETAREHNYNPSRICFEITERVEVSDNEMAQVFFKKLKRCGFQFAIDDFGAGFSSFIYLTKLPINYIKIDKSIIAGLVNNKTDQDIVRSIIFLAGELNMKIIAEGIENIELLEAILTYKIDLVQGYHFHKPDHLKMINPQHHLKALG